MSYITTKTLEKLKNVKIPFLLKI